MYKTIYIYKYKYICNKISGKRDHYVEGQQEDLEGGKGRDNCCNYFIILKIKKYKYRLQLD